jgi:hypothetical protein
MPAGRIGMKPEVISQHANILHHLSYLPRNILSLHGAENIPEFVLHDLCKKDCFNLTKAAYFVDNPDFDALKGVAGYSNTEDYQGAGMWENPKEFSDHMKNAPFNQKVRGLTLYSLKKKKLSHEDITKKISDTLGMKNPAVHSWDLKHDNHGFFVYELDEVAEGQLRNYLENGVCMFGFCPIF